MIADPLFYRRFVEVQFHRNPAVYADLLVKAFTYLKQNDPGQAFQGVVLFATKSLEPAERIPYQPYLEAGVVRPFFLDQLPEQPDAPLGLSILNLLRQSETEAPETARELIVRAKREVDDEAMRKDLIQLIETVIVYKLADLTREEIQVMLKIDDIRQTRVYREAMEEGHQEGQQEERQRQLEEKLRSIRKLAGLNLSPEQIADALYLDADLIRNELARVRD